MVTPFKKYIHYGGSLWLIFVKMRKRKFSQTLNTLEMAENLNPKMTSQKSIFEHTKMLFPVVWDPKKTIFISIGTLKVVPYDQGFRLVVIGDPQHTSIFL